MDRYAEMLEDLQSLRDRAGGAQPDTDLLAALEDALGRGYAEALSGEARMVRLEEQLERLMDTAEANRVRDFRELIREHSAIERSVARLRSALAATHGDFVALGGARVR